MCESSQISNDVKSKSERLVFNAQLKKHIQCTTKCVFVCNRDKNHSDRMSVTLQREGEVVSVTLRCKVSRGGQLHSVTLGQTHRRVLRL